MTKTTNHSRVIQEIRFVCEGERPLLIRIPLVVSRYRKTDDFVKVCVQTKQQAEEINLSRYGQSLLESCFKNW